jgi:pilus assembly protein FimV
MSVNLPRLMLMACLLSPSLSWALGLGEIHLNSALNEPLNAEIDLVAAAPEELAALRADLASREAFTRYGIDRPNFLSNLTFKVGKSSKDGRDVLQVRSTEAIPEPFVTFLVEVNWSRGRLMREYTVLLDPPVYTPGERAHAGAPVSAPTVAPSPAAPGAVPATPAPGSSVPGASVPATTAGSSRQATASSPVASGPPPRSSRTSAGAASPGGTYTVAEGDTLTKIVRSLKADNFADLDQTMIAVYRANPDAFVGNINILKRGAVLRLPGADEIAALNQTEAMNEVRRQMEAWRSAEGAPSSGHLRLVTPGNGTGSTASGAASSAENQALKDRVNDLQAKLDDARRLLDVRNSELAALQRKLASTPAPPPAPVPTPPVAQQAPAAPPAASPPPGVSQSAPQNAPPASPPTQEPAQAAPPTQAQTSAPQPLPPPAPVSKPSSPAAAPAESWLDWISQNYWLPIAVIVALALGLALAAWSRRRAAQNAFPGLDSTDIAGYRDAGPASGRREEAFVVEESGEHAQPEFRPVEHFADMSPEVGKASDDTMSSESAVNLDQGDPLAEADFHMAYGLYDQAADLVRIALEREPDRRDLRMKLLEIYFVWGNKDQFLQTAKVLETTRDRAPPGEWDKIVIMGKQICPEEPMFSSSTGSGRGAGDVVDLNLEGGENRVDIDLFGDPEGEHSSDFSKHGEDVASTAESPHLHSGTDLDFTLDSPERGADESPTREMPPRDEPTVESELTNFTGTETVESPALKSGDVRDRVSSILGPKTDQTAEVSIDDLGLDLDHLEESSPPSQSQLEVTDHPADSPTMLAGLDEKSRRMMADAESRSREQDMTELERELEASFIADLGPDIEESRLAPESAPTVQMPRGSEFDPADTSRLKSPDMSEAESRSFDSESTSRLRNLNPSDSIDLDLDKLASALGSGDTVEQPRAEEEVFSSEVFDATQRTRGIDLDVGESFNDSLNGSESPTNKLQAVTSRTKIESEEMSEPELEPVTMSEVGTKLDLARAYMDMGDPEGARSILEEVVNEGSASQKQEAQRLIEALPG